MSEAFSSNTFSPGRRLSQRGNFGICSGGRTYSTDFSATHPSSSRTGKAVPRSDQDIRERGRPAASKHVVNNPRRNVHLCGKLGARLNCGGAWFGQVARLA